MIALYNITKDLLHIQNDGERFSADFYTQAKAAGFTMWHGSKQFVSKWNPRAEGFILAQGLEIEDAHEPDDTSGRVERFEGYAERAESHADSAEAYLNSDRANTARRQRLAAQSVARSLDDAAHWQKRISASIRHAKYKERPDVIARRIKGLEADLRKHTKEKETAEAFAALWNSEKVELTHERAQIIAGRDRSNTPNRHARLPEYFISVYEALRDQTITPQQAREYATATHAKTAKHHTRWINHINDRLTYERAVLEAAGGTVADRKPLEIGGAVKGFWGNSGDFCAITKINPQSVQILFPASSYDHEAQSRGYKPAKTNLDKTKITAILTRAEVEAMQQAGDALPYGAEEALKIKVKAQKAAKIAPEVDQAQAEPASELQEIARAHREAREAELIELTPIQIEAKAKARELETRQDGAQENAKRIETKGELIARKFPGFFPTPDKIADLMAERAGIGEEDRVFDPSAGSGALLEAARRRGAEVHGIEKMITLAQFCRDQGLNVGCSDFLEATPEIFGAFFDVILINPPFENLQDTQHIKHAYTFLKPGGRMQAICSAGAMFRDDRRAVEFRAWLDQIGATVETLERGTFGASGTQVESRLLSIQKPQAAPDPDPAPPTPDRDTDPQTRALYFDHQARQYDRQGEGGRIHAQNSRTIAAHIRSKAAPIPTDPTPQPEENKTEMNTSNAAAEASYLLPALAQIAKTMPARKNDDARSEGRAVIRFESDRLHIEGGNHETKIRATAPASAATANGLALALNFQDFADLIKITPDAPIYFEIEAPEGKARALKIRTGGRPQGLGYFSPILHEAPEATPTINGEFFHIEAKKLAQLIGEVLPFAAKGGQFQAIKIEIKNGQVIATARDGQNRQQATASADRCDTVAPFAFLVSIKAAKMISAAAKENKDGRARVIHNGERAAFSFDFVEIETEAPHAPDYWNQYAQFSARAAISATRGDFDQVLNRFSKLAKKDGGRVEMAGTAQGLEIFVSDDLQECREILPVETSQKISPHFDRIGADLLAIRAALNPNKANKEEPILIELGELIENGTERRAVYFRVDGATIAARLTREQQKEAERKAQREKNIKEAQARTEAEEHARQCVERHGAALIAKFLHAIRFYLASLRLFDPGKTNPAPFIHNAAINFFWDFEEEKRPAFDRATDTEKVWQEEFKRALIAALDSAGHTNRHGDLLGDPFALIGADEQAARQRAREIAPQIIQDQNKRLGEAKRAALLDALNRMIQGERYPTASAFARFGEKDRKSLNEKFDQAIATACDQAAPAPEPAPLFGADDLAHTPPVMTNNEGSEPRPTAPAPAPTAPTPAPEPQAIPLAPTPRPEITRPPIPRPGTSTPNNPRPQFSADAIEAGAEALRERIGARDLIARKIAPPGQEIETPQVWRDLANLYRSERPQAIQVPDHIQAQALASVGRLTEALELLRICTPSRASIQEAPPRFAIQLHPHQRGLIDRISGPPQLLFKGRSRQGIAETLASIEAAKRHAPPRVLFEFEAIHRGTSAGDLRRRVCQQLSNGRHRAHPIQRDLLPQAAIFDEIGAPDPFADPITAALWPTPASGAKWRAGEALAPPNQPAPLNLAQRLAMIARIGDQARRRPPQRSRAALWHTSHEWEEARPVFAIDPAREGGDFTAISTDQRGRFQRIDFLNVGTPDPDSAPIYGPSPLAALYPFWRMIQDEREQAQRQRAPDYPAPPEWYRRAGNGEPDPRGDDDDDGETLRRGKWYEERPDHTREILQAIAGTHATTHRGETGARFLDDLWRNDPRREMRRPDPDRIGQIPIRRGAFPRVEDVEIDHPEAIGAISLYRD